jgi:hypothetical protein
MAEAAEEWPELSEISFLFSERLSSERGLDLARRREVVKTSVPGAALRGLLHGREEGV